MNGSRWLFVSLSVLVGGAAIGAEFERDVAPILVERCLGCHSGAEPKAGLDLSTREGALRGGESGPAFVPGDVASLLLKRVTRGEMPPREDEDDIGLSTSEVGTLRSWISGGAPWPDGRRLDPYERTTTSRAGYDWWSLRPITRPEPPAVSAGDRVANPIDSFILERLESEGMTLAPPAEPRALLRRLYFDLTGLPPSFEELEAFAREPTAVEYERAVDRLLASPHYGERWARYWLDLVRFAETNGYERDATKPHAWRYRDYVVESLNSDKPYDRFVLENLAGDELPGANETTVIATGFLRLGTWDDEPNVPNEYVYERLEDLVHTTSSTFLAMTVKCARCHDHKFDPIPQLDYYQLASAFFAGPVEPADRKLQGGPAPEQLGYDVLGWTDRGREVPALRLLKSGDPHRPLEPVRSAALSMVRELDPSFSEPPAEAKTTQRRLQLARWIVDPANPLTPRVIANRIWQHHFGRGLVSTPNNFGFMGAKPTHPELLDWLASELVRGGWRLKRLHRLIVLSNSYRSASVNPSGAEYESRDPEARWLWRFPRRRLDAEALRDAMLAVSGELDRRVGGPSFFPRISPEALEGLSRKGATWGESPESERKRRSLYIFHKRSLIVPFLTTFDFCDTTTSCASRDVTTVAPQALALLNNHFVHARSAALARRVAKAGREHPKRVELAWRFAFGRDPSERERVAALAYLESEETTLLARYEKEKAIYERRLEEARLHGDSGESAIANIDGLALWLRADRDVEHDDAGRLVRWKDQAGADRHAAPPTVEARPLVVADGANGRPALRFDGRDDALAISGAVLTNQQFTMFAVAADRHAGGGHREIISNWNRDGNSTTSVFLGTTGARSIRFSDHFAPAGRLHRPSELFLLGARTSLAGAVVHQGDEVLARRAEPLARRRLDTPWVVGTQGNYGSEFWRGEIAEIVVFDRALSDAESAAVRSELTSRYRLDPRSRPPEPPADPAHLALASLCHVLLSANEFIYVD